MTQGYRHTGGKGCSKTKKPAGVCRRGSGGGGGRDPPLLSTTCGLRHMGNVQGGGGGACECARVGVFFGGRVNVQEWGYLSFFGGRMTSRRQCPRGGGACECLDPPPPFR